MQPVVQVENGSKTVLLALYNQTLGSIFSFESDSKEFKRQLLAGRSGWVATVHNVLMFFSMESV